jgi:hypothetical protein
MRICRLLFAVCAVLLVWSGPVNAQERTFGGYDCTDDCLGHAIGYRWAEAKQFTDSSECPAGNSSSFHEGCLAYTEDPDRGADEDDDGNPIDGSAVEEWLAGAPWLQSELRGLMKQPFAR